MRCPSEELVGWCCRTMTRMLRVSVRFRARQVDVIERTSNRDDGVHDGHCASKSTAIGNL